MTADRSATRSDADGSDGDGPRFGLSPRRKSALLWGVVGALSFLAVVQGYALFVDRLVSIAQGVAIAALVGVGAGIAAYLLEVRIAAWAADRARDD